MITRFAKVAEGQAQESDKTGAITAGDESGSHALVWYRQEGELKLAQAGLEANATIQAGS